MLHLNNLLSRTAKAVTSVAIICLGLSVISASAVTIKSNTKEFFDKKPKMSFKDEKIHDFIIELTKKRLKDAIHTEPNHENGSSQDDIDPKEAEKEEVKEEEEPSSNKKVTANSAKKTTKTK